MVSTGHELTDTYEAQVLRALREIDQVLKLIRYTNNLRGGIDLADLKQRGLLPPDLVFTVSLADESGRVVASTRPRASESIAGRDYFEAQRTGDVFAVGRPDRPASGEQPLHFSRRLDRLDGRFGGVVVVSAPAAYFASGYESAKLGNHGVLGILGSDGIFRVRRTGDDVVTGEETDYAAALDTAGAAGAAFVNRWDGVRRYTNARELFEFPLAVLVGFSEAEQFAVVNDRAETYLWRATGGSVLLILIVAGLWQLAHSRARASRALESEVVIRRQMEAILHLRNRAIESSVNAILILDLAREGPPIEYVNKAFERITGYGAAEVMGRAIEFLLGSEPDQPGMSEIRMALRERREGHAVLRNYRKDGRLFWNDFYIAPVRGTTQEATHFVGVMNDVTEAKTYEEQLAHQAKFDALTGLANRNLLQDRLQQAIVSAHRTEGTVTAVFLDLDHFKLVNDSLGHHVGDELLCAIAERLKASVRESDTVARLGGDEFVLVLPGIAEADITPLIDKLLGNLSAPIMLGDRPFRPTCSIGVANHPHDGEDADMLLSNADAAMYRAKELGRNRFQFFTADVHERIRARMELESSLRLALERDEFELHYQPQVCLKTGTILGVEALLRWRRPDKGLVPPGAFIGFAEETGLIVPIGQWVLGRACEQNRRWQDEGLPAIPVSVNMSARQCEQPDVAAVIESALRKAGLAASHLELEITESVSMANPEQSVPLMRRLKETGVQLAIDDFGTGFSNLSYLRRFPVDRLKIDLSFVREITTDPGSLAISEAIITMSHSLRLQVVAEGVESKEQAELLGTRDCDVIQGHYFSPPVPPDEFARMLKDGRRLHGGAPRTKEAHALSL
jgi:diguanylate cyclase (GGDEF)-like protein/PAS domain S-box-containing protein